MGSQMSSHLQESQAPSCVMVTWEEKCHSECFSFLLLLLSDLYAEHDTTEHDLSLWSVGISLPGYVPSQLLVQPQSPCWWGGVRSRNVLGCKPCLAKTETTLSY